MGPWNPGPVPGAAARCNSEESQACRTENVRRIDFIRHAITKQDERKAHNDSPPQVSIANGFDIFSATRLYNNNLYRAAEKSESFDTFQTAAAHASGSSDLSDSPFSASYRLLITLLSTVC